MHTTALLAALLAPAAVSAQLHDLAVAAGLKYFGTEVGESASNSDSAYMAIVDDTSEFGQVVPENGQKWDSTEPSQGGFSYSQGDIVANIAKRNGQYLRCHTLVWHSQLPSWVTSGSWNKNTLQAVIENHISNVMGHYLGQCYAWDVVNEAIDDDGNWRDSIFYNTFGTDFFAISFNAAKAADPDTKLYYNDYNLEYNAEKTDRAVELVNILQTAGAPIDGVGFQGHLIVGSTPSRASMTTALERFTALNVDVAYTEVDIRHASLPPSESALVTQGNDFAAVVGSCLDVEGCVGVTIWGFTDKYSWVPNTFNGAGDALLYDQNFGKKPAWTSVSSVLAAAPTGCEDPPGTTLTTITTSSGGEPTPPPSGGETTTTSSGGQPTPPPSGGGQAHWEQCGGLEWNGPTSCQSPFTCQKLNDWYYQCL